MTPEQLACQHKFVDSNTCLKCGVKVSDLNGYLSQRGAQILARDFNSVTHSKRKLMYMMHPLGSGPNREHNRRMACLWQAKIQEHHPEWLVIAPWIALSGAWSEDRRDEGIAIDYATIDLCEGGIVAGPLDGPKEHRSARLVPGVSPGMGCELDYFAKVWPDKDIHDVRHLYTVEPKTAFRPLYAVGDHVLLENKQGDHQVKQVDQTAPGVFRYRLVSKVEFFAYEQSIGGKA